MYQLTLSPFARRMCPLLECVSEITNPFGLMRDCLFFVSFFWYLYCHSCSRLRAIFFCLFVYHASNVNLLCKKKKRKKRKENTSELCWRSLSCSLKARLQHRVLAPRAFEPEPKITIRAKRIREHKSIYVMCVCFQEFCPKETRTTGTISAPIASTLHPAPPT